MNKKLKNKNNTEHRKEEPNSNQISLTQIELIDSNIKSIKKKFKY